MRIAVIGFMHETNSFSVEENDTLTATLTMGQDVLERAHPRDYIGGFMAGAKRPGVELVPVANVRFVRGGTIHAPVFEHYRDIIVDGLRKVLPVDAVYLALHGAAAVQKPYEDAEASLIRAVRAVVGDALPIVATYDFHGNYTDWEVSAVVPFPLNTNPHIDSFERGVEAAERLFEILAGAIHPVTRRIWVPIIGPNIGQSTWSHIRAEEQALPLYQLNLLREEMEKSTPHLLNLTIQGGYGYSDVPYVGMCVIATADGDVAVAAQAAKHLANALWAQREQIRSVRPQIPIDEGVRLAMQNEDGLVCLVDLGDDPGSFCTADSPAVLESLIRQGARDCALTIRDSNVIKAAMVAGVGATLNVQIGASIDQRLVKPLDVSGRVKLIDDGQYKIVGPTHGGWGREVRKESFRDVNVEPRVVLRIGNKIDVICSERTTGKDRDFFKSAGIVLEEKKIIVVKSNQAHRASFDPIVAKTYNLDTPGTSTVNYLSLPFTNLPRPIYPIDRNMEWQA
jgi:microcystin degradation protein MlrC